MKAIKIISVILTVIMISPIFLGNVKGESDQIEIDFIPDPSIPVNETYNIGDPGNMSSMFDTMKTDIENMGHEANGTYIGSMFPPSKVELHWHPNKNRYTAYPNCPNITLETTINFSHQQIISGASEFWLHVPISLYSIALNPTILNYYVDIPMIGQLIDVESGEIVNTYSLLDSYTNPTVDPINIPITINDHIYYKFHCTILPDREYKIRIKCYNVTENIFLYVTNEDICGGDQSTNITYENIGYSENESYSLDLAWSFILTQGIGKDNRFGQKIQVFEQSYIQFYPYFKPTGTDQYVSFMIPFYSDDPIEIRYLKIYNTGMRFIGGSTFDLITIGYYYDGYFLATSDLKLNISTYDPGDEDKWVIELAFNETDTITLFCRHNWSDRFVNLENMTPTGSWYEYINYSFSLEYSIFLTEGRYGQFNVSDDGSTEYSYGFRNAAYVGNYTMTLIDPGAGKQYEQSNVWYSLYTSNVGGLPDLSGLEIGEQLSIVLRSLKNYLSGAIWFIYNASKKIYTTIGEGINKVYGYIKDFASWVWNGILDLGELVYTTAVSFYNWISDLISQLRDSAATIIDYLGVLVTIGLFMLSIAVAWTFTGKAIKYIREPDKREVTE